MKTLMVLDEKNYSDDMPILEKHTVRAIIEKDGKFIMQKSTLGEFKIPGGGVEGNESHIDTLCREVEEEVGLIVDVDTIEEIGEILELREDIMKKGQKYICHSYFYKCDVLPKRVKLKMTESEIRKGFQPVWEDIEVIVSENDRILEEDWMKRDTEFLRMYMNEKIKE